MLEWAKLILCIFSIGVMPKIFCYMTVKISIDSSDRFWPTKTGYYLVRSGFEMMKTGLKWRKGYMGSVTCAFLKNQQSEVDFSLSRKISTSFELGKIFKILKFSAGQKIQSMTLSFWRFGRRKIQNRAVKIKLRIKIKIKIINDDIISFN